MELAQRGDTTHAHGGVGGGIKSRRYRATAVPAERLSRVRQSCGPASSVAAREHKERHSIRGLPSGKIASHFSRN
jgi:hypothetical protein